MIELKGLTKEYKKRNMESLRDYFIAKPEKCTVLKIESLEIQEGEKVGIVGLNGSGKSTLIKLLTGVIKKTGGTVTVGGLDPIKSRRKLATKYGVMFGQRTQLNWSLPAVETYKALKEIYGVSKEDYNSIVKELKEALDLGDILYQPVRTLSLGQRVRLEVASLFLHNPDLLLLDEPSIGLDYKSKELIMNYIKLWGRRGKTLLITSHILGDIEELCGRILILDRGRLSYDGDIQGVLKSSNKFRNIRLTPQNQKGLEKENWENLEGYPCKVDKRGILVPKVPKEDVEKLIAAIAGKYQGIASLSVTDLSLGEALESFNRERQETHVRPG